MTTVPAHQASAGSAVNDTIREVGGSLGVAIVGSLAAAVYRDRLRAAGGSPHARRSRTYRDGLVAAASELAKSIGGFRGSEIVNAAQASYTSAMAFGMRLAGAVALLAAVGTFLVIPRSQHAPVASEQARLELIPASSAV